MAEEFFIDIDNPDDDGFHITDDGAADWAVRKIAEANADYQRMSDWYKEQLERLKISRDRTVEYMTARLREYFSTVPAKDTKTMRKYSLPSGELVESKPKTDFAVSDPDTLLKWCKENDKNLVRTKEEPAWSDIKKRLIVTAVGIYDSDTGLEVSGVKLEEKPGEFTVKAKGAN